MMKENEEESYSKCPIFGCFSLEVRRQGFFGVLVAKFEFLQSSEAVGDLVKGLLRLYLEQGRRVKKFDRPLYNEVTDLLHHDNFLQISKQCVDLHESDDPDGLGVGLAVGVYEAEEVEEDGKTLSEIRIFFLLHFLIIKIIVNQK